MMKVACACTFPTAERGWSGKMSPGQLGSVGLRTTVRGAIGSTMRR
jgi:hypothetical protein